jgi:hypothetical protein
MRCEIHCPPVSKASPGPVLLALAAIAGAVAVVSAVVEWVTANLAAVVTAGVLTVAVAAAVVEGARRLSLWSARRFAPIRHHYRALPARAPARAAITGGQRAIEAAPPPGITVRLDASQYQEVLR